MSCSCREADRLRRIKEEGFDRFAPLSENNPRCGCAEEADCAVARSCVSHHCPYACLAGIPMGASPALHRPDLVPKGYPGAEGVKD